jgi:hypothetical protein
VSRKIGTPGIRRDSVITQARSASEPPAAWLRHS